MWTSPSVILPLHHLQAAVMAGLSCGYFTKPSTHSSALGSCLEAALFPSISLYLTLSTVCFVVVVVFFFPQLYLLFLFLISTIFFSEFSSEKGSWFIKCKPGFQVAEVLRNMFICSWTLCNRSVGKWLLCSCLMVLLFHYSYDQKFSFMW